MSSAHVTKKHLSAAIISFSPDYGHAQPLLKIADALAEAGFEIHCYLAAECAPLMQRFQFDTTFFEPVGFTKQKQILAKIYAKSLFFNMFSSYVHHDLFYVPGVVRVAGRSAGLLKKRLSEHVPDVIIADEYLFSMWHARIAETLGAPLILNSEDGNLAHNQRAFVRAYGITRLPLAVQRLVEIGGAVFARLCHVYYRLRHVRTWLESRSTKRIAKAEFEGTFPVPQRSSTIVDRVCTGSARIELDRLGKVINTEGAHRRAFYSIRFRSFLPLSDKLRDWIGNEEGPPIVYVSFGSAVEIDGRFATAVYEGLRVIRARVLWSLPDSHRRLLASLRIAENIRLESFVPQPEILENSAVRCFVTQAGPWSVQEALFGGTPMLCIPFFADQGYNSSIVEQLGVGRRLWRSQVSAQRISLMIESILTNDKYLKEAMALRDFMWANDGGKALANFVKTTLRGQ